MALLATAGLLVTSGPGELR